MVGRPGILICTLAVLAMFISCTQCIEGMWGNSLVVSSQVETAPPEWHDLVVRAAHSVMPELRRLTKQSDLKLNEVVLGSSVVEHATVHKVDCFLGTDHYKLEFIDNAKEIPAQYATVTVPSANSARGSAGSTANAVATLTAARDDDTMSAMSPYRKVLPPFNLPPGAAELSIQGDVSLRLPHQVDPGERVRSVRFMSGEEQVEIQGASRVSLSSPLDFTLSQRLVTPKDLLAHKSLPPPLALSSNGSTAVNDSDSRVEGTDGTRVVEAAMFSVPHFTAHGQQMVLKSNERMRVTKGGVSSSSFTSSAKSPARTGRIDLAIRRRSVSASTASEGQESQARPIDMAPSDYVSGKRYSSPISKTIVRPNTLLYPLVHALLHHRLVNMSRTTKEDHIVIKSWEAVTVQAVQLHVRVQHADGRGRPHHWVIRALSKGDGGDFHIEQAIDISEKHQQASSVNIGDAVRANTTSQELQEMIRLSTPLDGGSRYHA
eukprot:TRINITY_DN28613_c0_g1_i1.p1 TRINITY_DN28613_c0_g1~~TRINITY_DN28613_c0_g1_i1.p1  ORF type:complete len:489 (+),score=76.36 TRINITY_DN28613_c0_g1_i1:131-1597(+)